MSAVDDLLKTIFDDEQHPLYRQLEAWLKASRLFRLFVERYNSKFRKKIRIAPHPDRLQDLLFEFKTAYSLTQERRFSVDYEKHSASEGRGADFTVTFKTHTPFNVEVTRLQRTSMDEIVPKLMEVLSDKAGQTQPNVMNVLLMHVEQPITLDDLKRAANTLKLMADRKEETFFNRGGFKNAVDYLRYFAQLSAVICQRSQGEALVWLNPAAKYPLDKLLVTILRKSFSE